MTKHTMNRWALLVLAHIAVLGFAGPTVAQDADDGAAGTAAAERERSERIARLEKQLKELEQRVNRQLELAERSRKASEAVETRGRARELQLERRLVESVRRKAELDRDRATHAALKAHAQARGAMNARRATERGFAELLQRARKGDAAARRELLGMRAQIDKVLRVGKDKPFDVGGMRVRDREMLEMARQAEVAARRMAEIAAVRAEKLRRRAIKTAKKMEEIAEAAEEIEEEEIEEEPGVEIELDDPVKTRERAPQEVAALIRALDSSKTGVQARYHAAVTLGRHKTSRAGRAALVRALEKDKNTLVRRAAAFSLGSHGKTALPALSTLIRAVGDKDAYVGYMAHRGLSKIAAAVGQKDTQIKFSPASKLDQRLAAAEKWQAWWVAWKKDNAIRGR